MNKHARLASASAGAGLLLLLGGLFIDNGMGWFQAHGLVMVVGVVLPGLAAWHNISLARFAKTPPAGLVNLQATLYVLATVLLGLGFLLQPSGVFAVVAMLGAVALVAVSVVSIKLHFASAPEESLVDLERDPLTKGDDASFKHLKFAHFFFPLATLSLLGALVLGFADGPWSARLWATGIHIGLIGYGLLSLYGIGHLWVPRFSGVPAIAVGAIKGELHSTLPSMILLPLGFMTGLAGFVIAGGAFAFLGFFTYMGVLGANIMRNKSTTHRVTPEFVYVPWTFTGIFWLVSGVLMGIFLTVVPDLLTDRAAALATVHVHINLFGGFVQLLLAWLTRYLPGAARPPAFAGAMRGAFYAFNGGVTIAVGALLGGGTTGWFAAAIALTVLGGILYFKAMRGFMPSTAHAAP